AIPGRRTTRAARLRHWRSDRDRPAAARRAGPAPTRTSTLASARPERPNTVSRAGPNVNATASATRIPTAIGGPAVRKIPTSVKAIDMHAAATVSPEARITVALPPTESAAAPLTVIPRRLASWNLPITKTA